MKWKRKERQTFSKMFDCEHKELFKVHGVERYEAIRKLPIVAPTLMCSFYKHCNQCPLFLDGKGSTRSFCVDCASDKEVFTALSEGAIFVTREENKNEKDS